MELKCISQATANLLMNAFLCAWLELVADNNYDEDLIDPAAEWAANAFVRFCEINEISLVKKITN